MIGAQWLVEPPPGWRVVPLRSLFERRKVLGFIDEPMVSVFRDHGVVFKDSRDNLNKTAEDRSIYQLIDDGWLVVNRMKAWQGSVGVSAIRGIVSGHYICFQPAHREESRYLNHLLRSPVYTTMFGALSRGVRNGQIEIDNDDLGSLGVLLPPVEEQRRIADFLDDQTTRIDQTIAARRQQVTLALEAYESEVDSHLEAAAGRYGWTTTRRRLLRIQQGWSPDCDQIPAGEDEWGILKVGAVKRGAFRPDENKRLPASLEPRLDLVVKPRDLLFTRANTRELVGDCCVVPESVPSNLILCDKIMRVTLDPHTDPRFVAIAALGSRAREHFSVLASGTSGSMVNIRGEDIQDMPLPEAPTSLQGSLVDEVAALRSQADGRVDLLARSIDKLQEFRRSLTSAAVSGEIDVSAASGRGVPS